MTTQFRSHLGAWRIASTERLTPNSTVTVARRNGQRSDVIIRALIAHDPSRDLPYLYSFDDVRQARGATPATRTEHVQNTERLFALFQRAATRQHSVAVRFSLSNTERGLRLEMAGPTSRYAGHLLALSEQRTGRGRRTMYGSLTRAGAFTGTVGATQIELDIFNEVATVLRGFAADPAGYSAAHGRATGNCCFCGRGLTDERSVAVGYGPICADYYGLPWGDAGAPAFDVAAGSTRQLERLGDNAGRPNAFDGSDRIESEEDVAMRYAATLRDAAGNEVVNRTTHGIETATGEQLDAWGRQFGVVRNDVFNGHLDENYRDAILRAQRRMANVEAVIEGQAAEEGVPTLEDIQNEPNGMRRMAMAAQRASAGLPNVMRDGMGRVIVADIRNDRTIVGTVEQPVRAGDPMTVRVERGSRPDQVTTTVRRVRPAGRNPQPTPQPVTIDRPDRLGNPLQRIRERAQARAQRERQGAPAPTDETTTTVVRAVRRDPSSPLEEDDFIWPPRNTETSV